MKKIFRGDGFTGSITLRLIDACNPAQQDVYPITGLDLIEVHFPGISPAPSVVLSSANPGEVTITDPNGTFTYAGTSVKSDLMNLSVNGVKQPLTIVVTPSGGEPKTFEIPKYLNIVDRANP